MTKDRRAEERAVWASRTPLDIELPPFVVSATQDDAVALHCPACELISGSTVPDPHHLRLDFTCPFCGSGVEIWYDPYQGSWLVRASGPDGQTRAEGNLRGRTPKHFALALCMTRQDAERTLAYHGVTPSREETDANTLYAIVRAIEERSTRKPLADPVARDIPIVGHVRDGLSKRWLRLLPPDLLAQVESRP